MPPNPHRDVDAPPAIDGTPHDAGASARALGRALTAAEARERFVPVHSDGWRIDLVAWHIDPLMAGEDATVRQAYRQWIIREKRQWSLAPIRMRQGGEPITHRQLFHDLAGEHVQP